MARYIIMVLCVMAIIMKGKTYKNEQKDYTHVSISVYIFYIRGIK